MGEFSMKKKSRKVLKILKFIILILAVSLLVVCGLRLYDYFSQLSESKEHINLIKTRTISVTEQEELPLEVDFEQLKKQNDDIIAWIYSEDTPLNYPIVQADDNSYYLRRLTNGIYNIAGSLFADFRNSFDFSDLNTIVYGHNMNNGSMFGFILNYKKQEYFEGHKFAYIFTPDKNFKVEFVAGLTVKSTDEIYRLPMLSEDRETIINRTIEKSDFISDRKIFGSDRFVTLSTCSYSFKDARYVLIGVIEEI